MILTFKFRKVQTHLRHSFFILFSLVATLSRAEKLLSLEAALREAFPGAAQFLTQTVELGAEEKASVDQHLGRRSYDASTLFAQALGKDGGTLGSAFVEGELGKHQPITFLVALDAQDRVAAVRVLTYREAQGGEIQSHRFLAQFIGKQHGDSLRLNSDVDAISGATISSSTITFGVRRALYLRARVAPFNQAATAPAKTPKGKRP